MTKFYIGLVDSCICRRSLSRPTNESRSGRWLFGFVSGDHGWSLALLRDLFSLIFQLPELVLRDGDCSLRHRNDEVPCRVRSGVFGCCTDLTIHRF
jgi:hypothetical protein